MKLTDSIEVSASQTTMTVTQDGACIALSTSDALALAVSIAKWATNPSNLADHGGADLRDVAETLLTEAKTRDGIQRKDLARNPR